MNLQTSIIKRYKEVFPKDTIKMISEKTSIQLTRVFRLISGHEMKVSEFEKFENAIDKQCGISNLGNLSKQCLLELSHENLNELISFMQRKLNLNQLKKA